MSDGGRNDWNVPDWRDPAGYPSEAPLHVWAWEFLRRNKEYRRCWSACGPNNADEIVKVAQEQFGLAVWSDPRSTENVYFVSRGVARVYGAGQEHKRANRVIYEFDLSLPLDKQFVNALKDAKQIQSGRFGKEITIKARVEKYCLYLRLLDAEDDNAGRAEVSSVLFRKKDDPHTDYDNHRRKAHELRDIGYRALAGASTP